MTPEDFRRLDEIVSAALELTGAERDAWITQNCAGDADLHRRVLELVAAEPADFLEPAITGPGSLIGPWRLERLLGRGGMGSVFLADRADGRFEKKVAVKLLDRAIPGEGFEPRFRREGEILARLDHPDIARLLDAGAAPNGTLYFVLEYVEGIPCTDWARTAGPDAAVRCFLQICEAVQFAHSHLVVHRDLKPSNILVGTDGRPRLLDFGISKILGDTQADNTATGFRALSLNYASPEQILGRPASTSDDVYSLGVILYEMLDGAPPYRLSTLQLPEVVSFAQEPKFPPPAIDPDLSAVVLKAMAAPAERYRSAEELAADLRRYLTGYPVLARAPGVAYRARKFVRRRWPAVLAAAAALTVLVVGGVSITLERRRAEQRFEDARSLAHYVLFDLYDSMLRLPGAVEPLSKLAGRTGEYLDRLASDASADTALTLDIAESYQRLGDLLGKPYTANLGDSAGGLRSYDAAIRMLDAASQRTPNDRALRLRLAAALTGQAAILTRQGRYAESLQASDRARVISEPLGVSGAAVLAGAMVRNAEARYLEASPARSVPRFREILAMYQRALRIQEDAGLPRTTDAYIGNLFRIGYTQASLGDFGAGKQFYDDALASYQRATALRKQMSDADPANRIVFRQYVDGLTSIAWARWQCCQDLKAALETARSARDQLARLAAADPQNREWFRDTGESEFWIGKIQAAAGQRAESRVSFGRALKVYQEILRGDPRDKETLNRMKEVEAAIN